MQSRPPAKHYLEGPDAVVRNYVITQNCVRLRHVTPIIRQDFVRVANFSSRRIFASGVRHARMSLWAYRLYLLVSMSAARLCYNALVRRGLC